MTDVPTTWTTGTTEVFKTGTWRAAIARHAHAPSPCHAACPVAGDVAEWIGRARDDDLKGAWDVLVRNNPFPAIAGRVCHHPCEAACNRGALDEAVAIRALERYVGDRAIDEGWSFAAAPIERRERIAVVGGGPSGLAAAHRLRRLGYRVSLFEAQPRLGGLMRYGIPPYRLPRAVLDAEIARVIALGVDVHCGQPIDAAHDFARLRREFDALYVAIGAARSKRLPTLDYDAPWVVDGARYLAKANAGAPPALGRRVVVIGGGSAAIDVARTARRAGHDVTIVALEARAQMPAQPDEVTQALEEGIALIDGTMMTAAMPGAHHVALKCVGVRFEPGARRGEFDVTPIDRSDIELRAEAIVVAIGQEPDLAPLAGVAVDGGLLATDARHATSAERVYAGGDVASLARFVTEAIGMGKRAALAIDADLRRAARDGAQSAEPVVPFAAINTHYYPKAPRAAERRLAVARRVASDEEVELALGAAEAAAECARCFSCGTCIRCDNCVLYCPDLAVKRADGAYTVLGDYCKGCGLCVEECPTGSMRMIEERR